MPTYIFRDMSTGEEFQDFMSINEKETYLQTNTNIVQLPNTINFVGDHIMGVGPKNDGGFNERMSQIASAHPNSPLADRYKTGESHKKLKTKEVIRKHQKRKPLVTK
jgi:hypothetical protein|tara:strand:+ start:1210 stop:1530 length:321 start_codon:yes stop_codon:yes gene_type:complete